MKVLLLIGQLGRGGAERQLCLLAEGLQRAGHDVRVVSVRGGPRLEELHAEGLDVRLLIPDAPVQVRPPAPAIAAPPAAARLVSAAEEMPRVVVAAQEQPELIGSQRAPDWPAGSPAPVTRHGVIAAGLALVLRYLLRWARILWRSASRAARLLRRGGRLILRGLRRSRGRIRRLVRERRRSLRRRLSDLIWLRRYTADFEDQLRDFRPDVVHAFLPSTSVLAAWVAPRNSVPVVVVGRRSLGWYRVERPLLGLLELLLTRRASCMVTNATSIVEEVVRRREMRRDRIHVIPNALPDAWLCEEVEREREPTPAQPLRFVTVANFRDVKGHDVAYRAFEQLADDGWDFTWCAVGGGPQRDEYCELAATRSWFEVGEASSDEAVMEHLDRSDIFVLPSRSEGMSNSLMEAMARGLACVATDVGGNGELLSGDGRIVASSSSEDLARALAELLADRALVADLQARARKAAERRFAVRTMVAEHERVYARYRPNRTR